MRKKRVRTKVPNLLIDLNPNVPLQSDSFNSHWYPVLNFPLSLSNVPSGFTKMG